ncbi:MAG TPA: phosphotransferase [Paracoccaceae bacterium]|nr:phosphotransferase [Paracoccaceae bacterium]
MTPAETAAAIWGGRPVRLIQARENAVWEMTMPGGARAALRLHRPGSQTRAAIEAELAWCAALADANLPVPRPLPVGGALTVEMAGGGLASAITWVEGGPMGEAGVPLPGDTAEQATRHRALGRLLAEVHTVTDALDMPSFVRPAWDKAGLVGEAPLWGRFWDHPAAAPDERSVLLAARSFLAEGLARAGTDFGPIHADVLRENVLVGPDGGLTLIDFDDSGTGWRAYDLGTVMSQNQAEPAREALRAALVEGYGELRPVDPAMVDLMTLARCCASVGWTMPRLAPGDPVHLNHIARAVKLARLLMG